MKECRPGVGVQWPCESLILQDLFKQNHKENTDKEQSKKMLVEVITTCYAT